MKQISNGYRGTVSSKEYRKVWREELRNNPHLFVTKIISYCETRKEALDREQQIHTAMKVNISPLHINKSIASANGVFGVCLTGKQNGMYNKKQSESSKEKISISSKLNWTKERKDKHRKLYGEIWSSDLNPAKKDVNRERMRNNNPSKIKIICEHCKKLCDTGNYHRWHGNNCKLKSGV